MGSKKIRNSLIKKGFTLKTFNQWSKEGFIIIKGSKSLCRNEYGQALFTDEQVIHREDLPCPACGMLAAFGCSCMYDIIN